MQFFKKKVNEISLILDIVEERIKNWKKYIQREYKERKR